MNTIDLIVLLLLSVAFCGGLIKGFFKQVFALVAIFGGVFIVYQLSTQLGKLLSEKFNIDPSTSQVIIFIVLIIIVYSLLFWAMQAIDKMVKVALPNILNRVFGGVLALAEAAVLLSVIAYACDYLLINKVIPESKLLKDSISYPLLLETAKVVFPYIHFGIFKG